jgi:arabinoxylan arabinofuranohydrolase
MPHCAWLSWRRAPLVAAVIALACHESAPVEGSAPATAHANVNGYARNPIVSHIFTADPSAHVFDGRVYVYASHDPDDQTAYQMTDYHVFSSADLVNWQDHGVALASRDTWAEYLYAPDCCYSRKQGKYYLYFPDSGSGIGVAVADGPAGPFHDALGKPLIDGQTPGVADVDWIFDPTCFVDEDGQAYLYFGGGQPGTGDNARVIRLNDDMLSLRDASATTIVAPDFFEAPFMHKYQGKYYFSYSTTYAQHAPTIDYMLSDQPMSGFAYAGTVLPNPENDDGDNNHHSMLEFEGKWYIFYHSRTLEKRLGFSSYQRSILLDYLSYDAQGKLVTASATAGRVAQLKAVDAHARVEAESMADQSGVEVDLALAGGQRVGVAVTDLQDQDWIGYSQLDFGAGINSFRARVAAPAGPSSIEVLLDGCSAFNGQAGELLASCEVPATGGPQTWVDVTCAAEPTSGVHDLCLRFRGTASGSLFELDYFQFE